jgi:hypothetical protein
MTRQYPLFDAPGYPPARLSGPDSAMFEARVVILPAAQRDRLRWWTDDPRAIVAYDRRDRPSLYALEARGLVRVGLDAAQCAACLKPVGTRHVSLTAAGAQVLDAIRAQDRAELARYGRIKDLYGDRRYTVARFCGTYAAETFLHGEQPMTCPACGSRTSWQSVAANVERHQCLNAECDFPFFAEPDAN